MDDKKIIKPIQDKLSQHRVSVPDSLWKRVANTLPAHIVWYKRKGLYGAVAAIAAIAIIICCYVANNDRLHCEPSQHICANRTVYQDSAHVESNHNINKQNVINNIIETEQNTLLTKTPKRTTPSVAVAVKPIEPTVLTAENNDTRPINQKEDTVSNDITAHDIITNDPVIAHYNNDESYYDDKALESIGKNYHKNKDQSSFLAFDATTSGQRTVVTPFSSRCYNGEVTFAHKMPFSMRALFEKRFGRWGLGVGLSYTYMVADYEMTHNIRQGKQELHYVGIPLYASFEFARVGKFAFYTSLGGQVDINTAGIHRELPESNAYEHFDKLEFRDKALQFSAQLRVGAAFEITKHFDIFIEPVLGYYFANGSKVHSIWHDTPLSTSIAFGVRTWF